MTIDDEGNREVTLVNAIQLKGVARKLKLEYKLLCQVQTRLKQEPPNLLMQVLRQKKPLSKQP